jgi:PKHD-type hydroxylase
MNIKNHYIAFTSVLPSRFCNDVLEYGKTKQEEIALTGAMNNKNLSKKEIKNLQKIRNSNIVWMEDKWIYKEIIPYVNEANKIGKWNFNWDYSESCQFTKYGPGQYYGWHRDSYNESYNHPNNTNSHGKIRKLSVTCSLSDPSEYVGGELEFNFNDPLKKKKENIKKCTEIFTRGSIVVFPSFVWHRVCPVKSGTRYSLVIWNLGYPFQ